MRFLAGWVVEFSLAGKTPKNIVISFGNIVIGAISLTRNATAHIRGIGIS